MAQTRFSVDRTIERQNQRLVYYNCDIINNTSADLNSSGVAFPDPPIRFNESRDTALLKDASLYEFSIVRFSMNGPNRNLPLLVPSIQLNQTDVNLTTYALALSLQQTWNVSTAANASGKVSFAIAPIITYITYTPECQNKIVAPTPAAPILSQDISTRYYYVTTYQWFLNLVNDAIVQAQQKLYADFKTAWNTAVAADAANNPFPYADFTSFQAGSFNTPQITYDPASLLFSVWYDSRAFGQTLIPFTPVPYSAGVPGPATSPSARFFMNTDCFGLFSNFPSIYWNTTSALSALVVGGKPLDPFGALTPSGYTYELLCVNKFYQNIVDYRQAPYGEPVPYVDNPSTVQQPYYKMTQDFPSVDSMWSPIASIVFTTSLLPVQTEQVAAPTILGQSNIGASTPTSASAFSPIITDISLDTTVGGTAAYRQFISYAPTGEYRMSSLTSSKTDVQALDVQVFWKHRLTSALIPVTMYNLSSVSFKMLFREKGILQQRKEER